MFFYINLQKNKNRKNKKKILYSRTQKSALKKLQNGQYEKGSQLPIRMCSYQGTLWTFAMAPLML